MKLCAYERAEGYGDHFPASSLLGSWYISAPILKKCVLSCTIFQKMSSAAHSITLVDLSNPKL